MILFLMASLLIGIATGLAGSVPWAVILSLAILITAAAGASAADYTLAEGIGFCLAAVAIFQAALVASAILSELKLGLVRRIGAAKPSWTKPRRCEDPRPPKPNR